MRHRIFKAVLGISLILFVAVFFVWLTGDYIFEITTGGRYVLISSRNHVGIATATDPTRDPYGKILAQFKGMEIVPGNINAFVRPERKRPKPLWVWADQV